MANEETIDTSNQTTPADGEAAVTEVPVAEPAAPANGAPPAAEPSAVEEAEEAEEAAAADELEVVEPTPEEIIAGLEAELAEAKAEAAAQVDRLQRLAAEFQNSKRRQEKQLSDAIDRAGTYLIQQLLPVLDDLELAFQNVPETVAEEDEAWLSGFRAIQKKLLAILDDQDVAEIATDGEFDPSLHEAVSSEPSDAVESGHIIATLRSGYVMKGRVLRPALVRVAM